MVTLEQLVKEVKSYNPDSIEDVIWKAYLFASKQHRGMSRLSGDPYLVHPLEVALILAKLRMDTSTIAAGLLHDVVEDTYTSMEEVGDLFGEEILHLVDGVTKISKIKLANREERQAENFRRMLLAMAQDIRVILIKLADRLHNMRTLSSQSPAKQVETAQETLDIYAPIANRLGIAWVKMELEDLSLKYLKPDVYEFIRKRAEAQRETREKHFETVIGIVSKGLEGAGIPFEIKGRLKHFYSIYQKMERQGISFDEVHDIVGFRIITDSVRNCYAILGTIHFLWKPVPGRFRDYIALPKPNMYQSLHTTVMGPGGHRVESQIRTEEMNRIAEEGIAAHWKYKESDKVGKGDLDKFTWLRHLLEWQQDLKDPKEFMEAVKMDLFLEDVYVFTPKGDVKSFPHGATPIDFAYSVHTDIGHHCAGAKVNGKLMPLRYQLKNGDLVEIVTSSHKAPSRDWLKIVKTVRARTKIKAWLKAEDRQRSLLLGRERLARELARYNVDLSKISREKGFEETIKKMGFATLDDLCINIGYEKNPASQIVRKILPKEVLEEAERKEKSRLLKVVKRKRPEGVGVKITGIGEEDILIRIAKCCKPVPGDPIVGFITRGRGLSVHKVDCPSLKFIDYNPERMLELQWDVQKERLYPVRISVMGQDRPGMLSEVSSAVASNAANITLMHAYADKDHRGYFDFVVEIKDLQQLNRIMSRIKGIKGVIKAERVVEVPGHKKKTGGT